MPTANEELLDASVRHQVYLQRYSSATVRKIIALLNRVDDRLVSELVKRQVGEESFTRRRLELLLEAVRKINKDAYNRVAAALGEELRDFAVYEAGFQRRMVLQALPVRLDIVQPSASQLFAAVNARPFQGRLLKDWYSELEAGAYRRLRDTIRMGFVEGRTTDQIVRDIRGTRAQQYRDGILEQSRRATEATVRTAVNHTATVARNETFKENEGVIKGVRWTSTLDGRTTMICISRDGEVYPLDKGPRPPAHINCRSTTTPVLKSWKEIGIDLREAPEGTRASLNGQLPASQTYGEWLKKQPAAFQDDVLGKSKGKLYRQGGLSVDKFVARNGDELTLDQLRRREEAAFEKVGL